MAANHQLKPARRCAIAGACAVAGLLGSCGGAGNGARPAESTSAPAVDGESQTKPNPSEADFEAAAKALADLGQDGSIPASLSPIKSYEADSPAGGGSGGSRQGGAAVNADARDEDAETERRADPITERLRRIVARMNAGDPLEPAEAAAVSALIALEVDDPGVDRERLASSLSRLNETDAAALRAIDAFLRAPTGDARRDAARQLAAALGELPVAPGVASEPSEGESGTDAQAGRIRIADAALCRRVESLGRYERFPRASFLAQRRQPVVLYVELENFAHVDVSSGSAAPTGGAGAPANATNGEGAIGASAGVGGGAGVSTGATAIDARDDDRRYRVQVGLEVRVFHSDGTLAWRRPEELSTDVSRRRRRDHFLTLRFDLPAALTVGSYTLKATVRDTGTGAVAERIIPFTIVADPALADR